MQIGANGPRKEGHQPRSLEITGQSCSGNGVLGIPALICTRGAQEGPQPTAVEQRGDTSLLLQGQVPHPVPSAGVQGTPAAPFPLEIPLQEKDELCLWIIGLIRVLGSSQSLVPKACLVSSHGFPFPVILWLFPDFPPAPQLCSEFPVLLGEYFVGPDSATASEGW